ncbi:hypothetical protein GOV10_06820 [Candidatus Woesearchaeota archaeon]|nr:hypothetical protein [Candidatus Woesearchaeota archaeon]
MSQHIDRLEIRLGYGVLGSPIPREDYYVNYVGGQIIAVIDEDIRIFDFPIGGASYSVWGGPKMSKGIHGEPGPVLELLVEIQFGAEVRSLGKNLGLHTQELNKVRAFNGNCHTSFGYIHRLQNIGEPRTFTERTKVIIKKR